MITARRCTTWTANRSSGFVGLILVLRASSVSNSPRRAATPGRSRQLPTGRHRGRRLPARQHIGLVISDRQRRAPRWTHFGRSQLRLTALPMLSLAWETRHATRELNEPVTLASATRAMQRHVGCWSPVERPRLSLRLRLKRLIRPSSTASDGSKCQVLRPSGTTGLNELDATPHGAGTSHRPAWRRSRLALARSVSRI